MAQSNTGVYTPLTEKERWLAVEIVDSAVAVHKALGPGLLESVYEKCLYYELTKRNISFVRQQSISIYYDNLLIPDGLRIDILVDNLIILELKAQDNDHPVWKAQLLSYLKLTSKRLGYILNFHVPLMKNGIRRMIL